MKIKIILLMLFVFLGFSSVSATAQEIKVKDTGKNQEWGSSAVCTGKYNKSGGKGFEIVNVRCESITDTCICEIDKKFNNVVKCGDAFKKPSFDSNLIDCNSSFIIE